MVSRPRSLYSVENAKARSLENCTVSSIKMNASDAEQISYARGSICCLSSRTALLRLSTKPAFTIPSSSITSMCLSGSHRIILRPLPLSSLSCKHQPSHSHSLSGKVAFTSVSCSIPPSRILVIHSSSFVVPNSFSSVDLLASSCAFCAPCLATMKKNTDKQPYKQRQMKGHLVDAKVVRRKLVFTCV